MVEYSTSCLQEREIHLARMVVPGCNLSTCGRLSQEACSSSSQPVSHSNYTEMSQQLGLTEDSDSILSTHEGRLMTASNSSSLGLHTDTVRFVNLIF